MRRRALLCAVGATALAGCGGRLGDDGTDSETTTDSGTVTNSQTTTSGATTAETTPETTTEEPPLELTDHELVRSEEGSASELATVTGSVRNPTDETVAAATVTATFEGSDGAVLDRASADASDLSPGQTWSFELVYPGTGEDARAVADYSLAVEIED
ncbi:FxLYD domain-containing protein [Halorussus litoreus]|uniref:FxLYD domain-containing protein n=1 Tax=Halorussus litoreus TaxID=1710536 RepID=UPI001300B26B|nr:FxLYD domain-containing protein [Halorussus litoreus]